MIKQMCGIFGFYFCLLTNNPKKYEYVTKYQRLLWILAIPLFIMFAHMLFSLITLDYNVLYSLYLHVFFISFHFITVHIVRLQAHDLELKLKFQQAEMDREKRREEKHREYERQERRKKVEEEFDEFLKWKSQFEKKQKSHNEKREQEHNSVEKFTDAVLAAFKVLELEPTSNPVTIKKQFRKLSKIYHPDMASGNEKQFKKLKNAYDVLIKHKAV